MKRIWLMAITGLLALALVAPTAVSAAPSQRNTLLNDIPVSGPLADGGTFQGLLDITSVALNPDGDLVVSGLLTGTATQGNVVTQITQTFTNVVADLTGSGPGRCEILNLDLGPIFLDLLGLEVDLSEINLDITAVQGAGNLLGNLLCAVAGLLDGNGPLTGINALLQRITGLLGGLLG